MSLYKHVFVLTFANRVIGDNLKLLVTNTPTISQLQCMSGMGGLTPAPRGTCLAYYLYTIWPHHFYAKHPSLGAFMVHLREAFTWCMKLFNILVPYTCSIYTYLFNILVQYTCSIYLFNILVPYTCSNELFYLVSKKLERENN